MKEISNDFPQVRQASLKQAIDHWRLPYWDWALRNNEETERLSVPRLFRIPQIEIDGPRGRTIIDNPLYRYRFPTNEDGKVDGISDIVEYNGEIIPVRTHPSSVRWYELIIVSDVKSSIHPSLATCLRLLQATLRPARMGGRYK